MVETEHDSPSMQIQIEIDLYNSIGFWIRSFDSYSYMQIKFNRNVSPCQHLVYLHSVI